MITTPMLQSGVEVDLPRAQAAMIEQKDDTPPFIISIQHSEKGGVYFINVGNGEDEPVALEEIYPRIEAVLKNKPETQVLNIDYGTVVVTMATLKQAGVPTVGLMTKSDD